MARCWYGSSRDEELEWRTLSYYQARETKTSLSDSCITDTSARFFMLIPDSALVYVGWCCHDHYVISPTPSTVTRSFLYHSVSPGDPDDSQ